MRINFNYKSEGVGLIAKSTSALYSSVLFAMLLAPCEASPLGERAFDTITISADEAREDEQADILYFKGRFIMQSNTWQLTSARATVYGRPDRPDKVHLEGAPAHFRINRSGEAESIDAVAPVVDYLRSANMLRMSGGAVLKLGDEVIHSDIIEYDIDTDRYRASGGKGVRIEVPAQN